MQGFKKRSLFVIIVLAVSFLFTVCVAAASEISYAEDEVKDTGQTLVTITKPEKNETVASKTVLIVGNTDYSNVRVELYIKNKDDIYEPKETTDKYNYWTIGSSGFFSKEIELDKGVNDLMIRAIKAGKPDQFSLFTIKVVDESLKDIIKNGINSLFNKITDFFK